ncbi:MAG: hypothetical protein H6739_22810 [Alphaproteobacteria bacterium]|nr:hypothetical protein [Alphaproteobacteria bacterium]
MKLSDDTGGASDDTASYDCKAGYSSVAVDSVVFDEFTLDGLTVQPTADWICATSDRLAVELGYTAGGTSGVLYVTLSEEGIFDLQDAAVTQLLMTAGDVTFVASDFYVGTVGFTTADTLDAVDATLYGEATQGTRQLILSVRWRLPLPD